MPHVASGRSFQSGSRPAEVAALRCSPTAARLRGRGERPGEAPPGRSPAPRSLLPPGPPVPRCPRCPARGARQPHRPPPSATQQDGACWKPKRTKARPRWCSKLNPVVLVGAWKQQGSSSGQNWTTGLRGTGAGGADRHSTGLNHTDLRAGKQVKIPVIFSPSRLGRLLAERSSTTLRKSTWIHTPTAPALLANTQSIAGRGRGGGIKKTLSIFLQGSVSRNKTDVACSLRAAATRQALTHKVLEADLKNQTPSRRVGSRKGGGFLLL